MTRFRGAALLVACSAALAVAIPVHGAGAGRAHDPGRLGVRGVEYDLLLSRGKMAPGPAIVQFQNRGEDPHELDLQKVGGGKVLSTGELVSGENRSIRAGWLKRGARYRLWCPISDHASRGMDATFVVKRSG